MKKKYCFLILLIILSCNNLVAQDTTDYYNPNFLRYDNHEYSTTIHTVIFSRTNLPMSDPVMSLGDVNCLQLTFDDFGDDSKEYSYRIVQCDADWNPSTMSENEFIDGFYTDHISEYKHSFSTLTPYIHYQLSFPNAQMRPTKSGNYILIVYENDQTDVPVITRRFWVVDNKVAVFPRIHRATAIEFQSTSQEVDFKIQLNKLQVQNPYQDLRVVIRQNNRSDNQITNLKPLYVKDGELDYDYEEGNVFEGGNEFRNFDTRSIKFLTQFTDKISQDTIGTDYHFYLKPDLRKSVQHYSITDDINGRYLIKVYDGRDGDLEGDYVKVHFRVPVMEPLDQGNLYIYGALTNWNLIPQGKMKYEEGEYSQTLLVKQGYYNYQYLFLRDKQTIAETVYTEGDHFETGNDYSFFVYWKSLGGRYDQLVGYKLENTTIK